MNIVITGASKGIGKSTIREIVSRGNHTILAISRDKSKLNQLQGECKELNNKSLVIPLVFDLSDSSIIKNELIPYIEKEFKHIDILINNAAYLKKTNFSELTPAEMKFHYEVNVFSPLELIRNSVNLIQTSSVRHIVNIGTMGAIQGSLKYPGMLAYSSGKAALASMTELLHEELKPWDIRVNYLALGAVETEMFREAFPDSRAKLKPEEIAHFISDFALNGWNYFSGKLIPVSKNS